MILTPDNQKDAAVKLQSFSKAVQTKIQHSSVKLLSNDQQFTGSGVILSCGPTSAVVVTAKHNLWKKAVLDEGPDWNSDQRQALATNFCGQVKIHYNNLQQSAPIVAINFLGGDDGWSYDVMLLSSNDANFTAYARNAAILVNPAAKQDAIDFFSNYRNAFNNQQNTYIQTGYGQVRPNDQSSGGPFQYRLTTLISQEPETVPQDDDLTYSEVVRFTADPGSTTAPGDSGGPLFAVSKTTGALYLLGVTLGENYDPENVIPDGPTQNNASTLLTSLLYATK
jgi:hypothetical protein